MTHALKEIQCQTAFNNNTLHYSTYDAIHASFCSLLLCFCWHFPILCCYYVWIILTMHSYLFYSITHLSFFFTHHYSFPTQIYSIVPFSLLSSLFSVLFLFLHLVSKEFLKKLWLVSENLAGLAIGRNNQIHRQIKDNPLYRNWTTNDRMVRWKRVQIVLFTDTMLVSEHKSLMPSSCKK